jgi:hypothetical protein
MEILTDVIVAFLGGAIIRTVIAFMLQWVIGSDTLHRPHIIIGIPCCIMMALNDTKLGVATILGVFLIEWLTLIPKIIPTGKKA